ncbi:hypothetical protein BJX62DRAFT_68487 [Aspergillus germanicus]
MDERRGRRGRTDLGRRPVRALATPPHPPSPVLESRQQTWHLDSQSTCVAASRKKQSIGPLGLPHLSELKLAYRMVTCLMFPARLSGVRLQDSSLAGPHPGLGGSKVSTSRRGQAAAALLDTLISADQVATHNPRFRLVPDGFASRIQPYGG